MKTKTSKKISKLTKFLNGSLPVRLGLLIGRLLNRKVGFKLADRIAWWVSGKTDLPMVKAVHANQRIVRGNEFSQDKLRSYTFQVFQTANRSLFDYFHYVRQPNELAKLITFSTSMLALQERVRQHQPCIVVGPHVSNFDLMAYAITILGIRAQVLSAPNPTAAYQAQNRLRRKTGIDITPISVDSFRQALAKLRAGGVVVTGIDRPITESALQKYMPSFFGIPADLPVMHVRLAIETDVPIYVMSCIMQADQTYQLQVSAPIWIEPMPDLKTEIEHNAERVLFAAEDVIRQYPGQWVMFLPVWQEGLAGTRITMENG